MSGGLFRKNSWWGGKKTRKPTLGRGFNKRARVEHLESREMLTQLLLTVQNLSPNDGLFATPFWVGFHNGRFDLGSEGQPAGKFGGLEALAEEGDTSGVSARFFKNPAALMPPLLRRTALAVLPYLTRARASNTPLTSRIRVRIGISVLLPW